MNRLFHLRKVFGTPGATGQHRKLKYILKKRKINADSFFGRFITEIDAENKRGSVVPYIVQSQYLLQKVKVETVVSDEQAEVLIKKIVSEINTGNYGDGKIFIYEVLDAVRIRTGERGEQAL